MELDFPTFQTRRAEKFKKVLWIIVYVVFFLSTMVEIGCAVYIRFFLDSDNIFGSHTDITTLELTQTSAFLSDTHDLFLTKLLNVISIAFLYFNPSMAVAFGLIRIALDISTYAGQMGAAQSVLFHLQLIMPLQLIGVIEQEPFAWWGLENWWSGLAYWVMFKDGFSFILFSAICHHRQKSRLAHMKENIQVLLKPQTPEAEAEETAIQRAASRVKAVFPNFQNIQATNFGPENIKSAATSEPPTTGTQNNNKEFRIDMSDTTSDEFEFYTARSETRSENIPLFHPANA